ncbi:MAG: cyclopropane-fatty-acyl-phospholipid synthase [Hyphomicrobiales bacterium]|nr:MAG: cyclopropane-fatty-acyl-phospholipid synthase [Hyphomicrobiales bacterium]
MRLIRSLLEHFVGVGTLRAYDHTGELHVFEGKVKEPVVTMRIHDGSLYTKIFLSPDIKAAEAYMDGKLTFEEGTDLHDFMSFFLLNERNLRTHPLQKHAERLSKVMKRVHQFNPRRKAAKNVAHHYDLSTEMYKLFLDDNMQYTCAYYQDPETETLEQAQRNKARHVCAKMRIRDGMHIAELGCGWGGFALYLAQMNDVKVTSVNLSKEQIAYARAEAKKLGVEDRVDFKLMDYRDLSGQFDRVISIGMMEHVGVGHYDEFFEQYKRLMKPDGAGFIHSIGTMSVPGTANPFLRKYIFPGGHAPSYSEFIGAFERARFWLTDNEVLRKHYHYTLMEWRRRFLNNWDKVAAIYDERFCRMWEFYLTGTAFGFLHGRNMVFHLVFTKNINTLPMCRDYIAEETERLRRREEELGIAL